MWRCGHLSTIVPLYPCFAIFHKDQTIFTDPPPSPAEYLLITVKLIDLLVEHLTFTPYCIIHKHACNPPSILEDWFWQVGGTCKTGTAVRKLKLNFAAKWQNEFVALVLFPFTISIICLAISCRESPYMKAVADPGISKRGGAVPAR